MTEKENQKEKDNYFFFEDNLPSITRINYARISLEEVEDLLKFGNEKVRQKTLKYLKKHAGDIL